MQNQENTIQMETKSIWHLHLSTIFKITYEQNCKGNAHKIQF